MYDLSEGFSFILNKIFRFYCFMIAYKIPFIMIAMKILALISVPFWRLSNSINNKIK